MLNADCPAGEHCDLGECDQSCNSQEPCASGLVCSPRAECLPPGQADSDPTTTQSAGTISASPTQVFLTDRNTSLDITLTSTGKGMIPYRIQANGPYFNVGSDRGQFSGTTTLHIPIATAGLAGHDIPGSVEVYTSLGNVVVNAPIHVSMTGSYSGALRYSAGNTSLGDTRIALDVLQDNAGDVSVRIQSQESLLFPATATGETTGTGQYSPQTGLDFTVVQVVDPSVGGDRNHFGRSIGRSIHFQLTADTSSNLSGTFTESITGLFSEPVTATGTASLSYQPTTQDPNFTVVAAPALPTAPTTTPIALTDVFPNWTAGDCTATICPACPAGQTCTPCDVSSALDTADQTFASPLYTAYQSGDQPVADLATACGDALAATSVSAWQSDQTASQCGLEQALACALQLRAQDTTSDDGNAQRAVQLVNEMLAPALLVAKNDNVQALQNSFALGVGAQLDSYNDAMGTLAPAATWVLQPYVLDYLLNISAQAASGSVSSQAWAAPATTTYPAARALADLMYTSDTIDGARAQIEAASASGSQTTLATQAQGRALVSYLESMALSAIVQQWASVPSSVMVHVSGLLTPLDNGFEALVEGANAFGVPSTFVPFVYNPANAAKGTTNFEQMLAIANNSVANESSLETAFLADQRTYESNLAALNQQLSSVQSQYDLQIANICGPSFDIGAVTSPDDWQNCGAADSGSVGALGVEILQAQAKVQADQDQINGQKSKIQIDTTALEQVYSLQQQNIQFISSTGSDLDALDFASGMISAEQSAIQVASNAQLLNLGAPLGEATVTFMLGAMQTAISVQKQQLETAQQMQAAQLSAQEGWITGAANIQKEEIDLAQMTVDIEQDQLAVLEQQILQANQVEQAKGLYNERERILAQLDSATDPLDDPSYRLIADQLGLQIISARSEAQQQLYLAGSALQLEINQSLDFGGAVLNASNSLGLNSLSSCLLNLENEAHIAYGTPQPYRTTVSVSKLLGITGPRVDPVTGQTLSEGDQFRDLLLKNQNIDGNGDVGITFSTDLQPGNELWASDVCADRIVDVAAELVGNFLGDNEAQVNLSLTGGSVMMACDGSGDVTTWTLGSEASSASVAVIQAGVNTFGEVSPNTSLYGQPVARASWKVIVPSGATAPSNADVDLSSLDDIVLQIDHQALPIQASPPSIDTSCLAQIGGGQ